MIRFDFNTYVDKFIDKEKYNQLMTKKEEIIDKLDHSNMTGWRDEIDPKLIEEINETAKFIKYNYDCLVVIGIGGSFLGSYAFDSMFRKYFDDNKFEIIYAGTTLSSKYLDELLRYLTGKNFCINVISKSGKTMETTITYKLLKDLIKRKYPEEVKDRIIITTDKENGPLREEANTEGYKSFVIPNNIGGRYSFITPAHLLPLALNYNINEIIDGYYHGKRLIDNAYQYAVTRKLLFDDNRYVENFCVNEQNFIHFIDWVKQLFGETEGKERVGILPTSCIHTRDLHSLGQFIQDGNKIVFETYIKVKRSDNFIEYNGRELHEISNIVEDSVIRAHYKGDVPCIEINIEELTPYNIANLIYFFQLSAAFSAYLFGVEPFDQPGVEIYKQEIRESLG